MSFRDVQNPGIGGLEELTTAEELFVQNLAGLSYAQGDILYHNGTNIVRLPKGTGTQHLAMNSGATAPEWVTAGGTGTVTSVSVVSANGISGSVATATTTPAITLTLGAITPTGVQISGLTASEIVGTDASKNLVSLAVATYPSLTELAYLKGATSAIQTQITAKAPSTSPTFGTSITGSYLTASEILITDADKKIVSAAVATYPSLTELSYVKGVTSAIQTQLGAKQATITFGTGVQTALGINVGSAGAPVLFDGALGTPTSGTLTNCTGLPVAGITASTITALGVGSIELGHATDTTLSRVSAGVVAIEGVNVVTTSSTDTLSNKTLTAPKFADAGFIADNNGNEQIKFSTTASAVNEITVKNSATTTNPQIQATGGDTNIGINLVPKGTGIVKGELKRFMVRLLSSTTDQTTGTTVGGDYRISNRAITVKAVGAYVDTAGTTNLCTVDINEAGTTILSTKITIDSTEKSSETAATPSVISDSAIAADAIITFDIDAIQTTAAKGLVVWIDYVYA